MKYPLSYVAAEDKKKNLFSGSVFSHALQLCEQEGKTGHLIHSKEELGPTESPPRYTNMGAFIPALPFAHGGESLGKTI